MKKLIATCYAGSPVANTQLSLFPDEPQEDKTTKSPHKIVITEIKDGAFDLNDIKTLLANKKNALTRLKGDGDFRSPECIELLKEADIVATNPPFSLFREYITQLVEYDKKFIVIGNLNAIAYKEIFPLLKENRLWLGATCFTGGATYFIADSKKYDPNQMSNPKNAYMKNGDFLWRVNGVRWFTNLDHKKRHEEIILYEHYTPEKYPKYDNYDAINIDKCNEIPCDYDGLMGVPISFMDKYCPEQFEIVGTISAPSDPETLNKGKDYSEYIGYKQNREKNNRTGSTFGKCPVIIMDDKKHPYYEKDGIRIQTVYHRIFIRRTK